MNTTPDSPALSSPATSPTTSPSPAPVAAPVLPPQTGTPGAVAVLLALLVAAVGGGGYWLGTRTHPAAAPEANAPTAATPAAASSTPKARKLLYYRNPMGLPDTSPVPKKDSMGMDYLPVYEGEDEGASTDTAAHPAVAGAVRLGSEKQQLLGVRTEPAAMKPLGRTLRATGRVEPDERRVAVVTAKFEGYVERLRVDATGQAVARGQVLFDAYSPELLAAQREVAIALQGQQALKDAGPEAQAGMRQLAEAALTRLRLWDLPAATLQALAAGGAAQRTVPFVSPAAGIVTEKKAVAGMRFMPGEVLYQVTDLSSVWVVADVAEQDLALVKAGARARVSTSAYPGEVFEGRVTFVYPTLKPETRTVPVRIELANPRQRLKPAMFAQVDFSVGAAAPVLTVPDSALIDTGTRRLVLVRRGDPAEGRFEPREVEVGQRGDAVVEILKGLRAGEPVVVAANFLIDAESNLKAVIGNLAAASPSAPAPAPASASAPAMLPSAPAASAAAAHRH